MEVQTPTGTYQLENLDHLRIWKGEDVTIKNFGSWDRTLYKRGFETIVEEFLQALDSKDTSVSPVSSLLSHWICDQITTAPTCTGKLNVLLPKE